MTYKDHISQALLALGSDDEAEALAQLREAEAEAAKLDPEGPRVAEVLNYVAQLHSQAGRPAEARAALERVTAIWERFPDLSAGLGDYYLQLMALSAQLGDSAAAEAWQAKAKAVAPERPERPWR
jgi:hypothetical protein